MINNVQNSFFQFFEINFECNIYITVAVKMNFYQSTPSVQTDHRMPCKSNVDGDLAAMMAGDYIQRHYLTFLAFE